MLVALTREPSSSLAAGERTFRTHEPIDIDAARFQHRAYREALTECGAHVIVLQAVEHLPDAVFVEDVAIVLDEIAILLPMGVGSRSEEPERIVSDLRLWREVVRLPEGTRAEGGDVVRLDRKLYVGRTGRSDDAGIAALAAASAGLGYQVVPVEVAGCLHLKSACTALDDDTILVNPEWVDASAFAVPRAIEVPAVEPWAANAVRAGEAVLVQAGCPRTADRIAKAGFDVREVDVSELAKAEGSLTCLSLLFDADLDGGPRGGIP